VFKAFLGETLNQFVKRQRLERALFLMSHAPRRSLTDVALDCVPPPPTSLAASNSTTAFPLASLTSRPSGTAGGRTWNACCRVRMDRLA
jgi:hypothetical protein